MTRVDLDLLTADLPATARPGKGSRRERRSGKLPKEWGDWAGTSCLMVTIWGATSLASGEPHFFWPVFPVGIWAAVLVAGTVFGGGSGHDRDDGDSDDGDSDDGANSRPL